MNYKKMLAVTAVTSAAIIVPVAVQAAPVQIDLFATTETEVNVGTVLTIASFTNADGSSSVTSANWSIVDGTSETAITPPTGVTTMVSYIVPYEAQGKQIKVAVTGIDGTTETKTIDIKPVVQNATLFEAPIFGETVSVMPPVVNGQAVAINDVKWYVTQSATDALTAPTSEALSYIVKYEDVGKYLTVVATASDGTVYSSQQEISAMAALNASFNEVNDETNALTAVATATINKQLSTDLTSFSGTIMKYEWFIKDGANTVLIEGENDMLINVPLQAAGKTLLLVVTAADGTKYFKELPVDVFTFATTLEVPVTLNGKEIDFDSAQDLPLAPKDVLAVGAINLEELNLLPSQVELSYEWYFTTGINTPASLIPNATNASFTVPSDAFVRSLDGFKVLVKISVPALANVTPVTYESKLAILNIQPAQDLADQIAALVQGGVYDTSAFSELDDFETELNTMQSKYEALSTNSKVLVPNNSVLQTTLANVLLVKPFVAELQAFQAKKASYDADKTTGEHAKLVKEFTAIEKKYNGLTRLQRSLLEMTDFGNSYVETMVNLLKNSNEVGVDSSPASDTTQTTYAAVEELNQEILALVSLNELPNVYIVADTRAQFAQQVEVLLEQAKTIDRTFQPIIYTSILKTALSDVKKVEAAVEKINKVTLVTGSKKASAAKAAQGAVEKLTALQYSLLMPEELEILAQTVQSENDKIAELIAAIDEVLENGAYKLDGYSYTHTADETIETVPAILAEQFKALSSDSRKLVTNYTKINVFKKDLKAAQKVMTAINNALFAEESIDEATEKTLAKTQRAALTKYRSAYKAYVKLTPQQRSIVDQHPKMQAISFSFITFADSYKALSDDLNIPVDDEASAPDDEPSAPIYDDSNVRDVIDLLITLEESVTNSVTTLEEVQAQIANIKIEYKKLTSAERKNVYNYSSLSTANSIANKAKSAKKKLDTAIASNDSKKLTNALAAYAKLTAPQQLLIQEDYDEALEALEELRGETPAFEDLASELETLVNEPTLDGFNLLEESIKGLTSKELKLIPNFKQYEAIVKDKKAVEKYFAKLAKIGSEPTYAQKEALLEAFHKLTTRQQTFALNFYPESDPSFQLADLFTQWEDRASDAMALNDEIGSLLVAGTYSVANADVTVTDMDDFMDYLERLQEKIKALDSKESKLITHRDFIKTAEKDAKVVSQVIKLAESFEAAATKDKPAFYEQWERQYERLSISQQSLYDLVSDVLTEPVAP